jgi:uncharacterized protein YdeI (YjbR/CyaY-like superfamily)
MGAWLAKNHSTSQGIWGRLFRKASGSVTVTNAEALDSALCYGWITGQSRPFDGTSWLGRFVPRRPRSIWSKVKRGARGEVDQGGRMKPAGLKQIEGAKRDGRWDRAYSPQSKAKVPADFTRELKKNEKALAFFGTLNKANVYSVVFRLETAKDEEARKARINRIIKMFEKGEKFH